MALQLQSELERARREGIVDVCLAAERKLELTRGVLLAIASRETNMRNIVGDKGHGRGLFQIDDRFHGDFLRKHGAAGPGRVPPVGPAAEYAAGLLRDNLAFGRSNGLTGDTLFKFSLSAYNAGAGGALKGLREQGDSDARTTGRNYGRDVLERLTVVQAFLDGGGLPPAARPVLGKGDRGPAVLELKRLLRAWAEANPGTRLPGFLMNDAFGAGTDAAVRAYQRAMRLDDDGLVGKDTWGALLRVAQAPRSDT